jgi:hypothetical protein
MVQGPAPPKVVYIAAWHRSGSTILDQVLGSLDGWFSGGELNFIGHNLVCGCGVEVNECPFWRPVLEEVCSRHGVEPAEILAERDRYAATTPANLIALARERRSLAEGNDPAIRYPSILRDLYATAARAAGARVIVDSTKNAIDAFLIAAFTDIELSVVHLVRDPRANAYSWGRKKIKLPPNEYFEQRGLVSSSVSWLTRNAAIEALLRRRCGPRYKLVRYEDFVADPRGVVEAICDLAGESSADLPFTGEHTVRSAPNHTVAGNPARFMSGELKIALDDEWRRKMTRKQRALATLPAAPLMPRYGYPLGT